MALRRAGLAAQNLIGGRRTNTALRALVVAEVALALTSLVGADLLLRSFWKSIQVNPGFRAGHGAAAEQSQPALSKQLRDARPAFRSFCETRAFIVDATHTRAVSKQRIAALDL